MPNSPNLDDMLTRDSILEMEYRVLSDAQIHTQFKDYPFEHVSGYGTALVTLLCGLYLQIEIIDPCRKAGSYSLPDYRLVKTYKRRHYPCNYTGILAARIYSNSYEHEFFDRYHILSLTDGFLTDFYPIDTLTLRRIQHYVRPKDEE